MIKLIRRLTTLSLLLARTCFGAQAQQKTAIHLAVPYAAGGAANQIKRLAVQDTLVVLGVPVVIDNKAGAAGMIAGEAVARAEPMARHYWWDPTPPWSSTKA
jgi:tripartite-type tricarboxylate transporter receptor subunit TctC